MGIATGEAELRDNDYFGTVLNRAARVMAAGHGGQILVADSTAGLLSGVELVNLGPRRLRDISEPVTVFQATSAGPAHGISAVANTRFESGKFAARDTSLDGPRRRRREGRSGAPIASTGHVDGGRRRRQDEAGIEVATQMADEFPDGVWVFELAAVADPAAVPDAVAAVLGITNNQERRWASRWQPLWKGGFDFWCSTTASTSSMRRRISSTQSLRTRRPCKILATSREGSASPTSTVAGAVAGSRRGRGACSSNARARDGLSGDESTAVEEICRRLDGIPLAIELAASRMASMTAAEVRDRLDDRFKLLVGSRRGLERHQTLRQRWHGPTTLDDAEKALLERCSVFAGGFDLQSACAIAGFDGRRVRNSGSARRLVRKSLLVADRSSGHTRYLDVGDDPPVRRRSTRRPRRWRTRPARRMRATSPAAKPKSWRCGTAPASARHTTWFAIELANLRTAFRWAADHDDLDVAAAIAT